MATKNGWRSLRFYATFKLRFNNKWQPRKTSNFNDPIDLGGFGPGKRFNRENIEISPFFDDSGLIVDIGYTEKSHYFKLFNKHSAPLVDSGVDSANESESIYRFFFGNYENELYIAYIDNPRCATEKTTIFHNVLTKTPPYDIVKTNHSVTNLFEAPFFYEDSEHVFFVKPEERLIPVSDPQNVGVFGAVIPDRTIEKKPFKPLWEKPDIFRGFGITELFDVPAGIRQDDPRTINLLAMAVYVNKVVPDNRTTVIFDDEIIGPTGSQHAQLLYNNRIGKGIFEMITIKGVPK